MTKFSAAVLTELNRPLELVEVELTNALSTGQVLIRMIASGVCGSQLLEIQGGKGNAGFLPHLLGHEGFGEVLETGSEVSKVEQGDFVVLHWRESSGAPGAAPKYFSKELNKSVGSGLVATLSELAVVSQTRITKVPASTDPALASLLGCGLSTGLAAIDKEIASNLGDSFAILGSGGVGIASAIGTVLKGAGLVLVVDKDSSKEEYSIINGADRFMTPDSEEWKIEALNQTPHSAGFDFVIEATGSPEMIKASAQLLKFGGTIVQLGQSDFVSQINLGTFGDVFAGGKRYVFSQGGSFNPEADIPRYVQAIQKSQLSPQTTMISKTGALADVNDLISGMRNGEPGRPLIKF